MEAIKIFGGDSLGLYAYDVDIFLGSGRDELYGWIHAYFIVKYKCGVKKDDIAEKYCFYYSDYFFYL